MATLAQILTKKYQQYAWTVEDDDYSSLVWYPENSISKPTEEEIRTHNAEVSVIVRWEPIKNRRNKLLTLCDWTQLPDCQLSPEKKVEWTTYRQQLRDLPQQGVEPENIVWPVQPS